MEIIVYRKSRNELYAEGELWIGGRKQSCTVEATREMLPVGTYVVRIVKRSARRQSITVFEQNGKSTGWTFDVGLSWKSSRKNRCICIGQSLIPGILYKCSKDYERIVDRLEKCRNRGEKMVLTISEQRCVVNMPIRHWQKVLATIALASITTSCSSYGGLQPQVVEHVSRDTVYINRMQYDSIFVGQQRNVDRSADTVLIQEVRYEYRYRLLHDTVLVHSVDSIPVIREVEVNRASAINYKKLPWWCKVLNVLGLVCPILLAGRLILRSLIR